MSLPVHIIYMIKYYFRWLVDLYRSSNDASEKKELLQYLVMTGSDEVWSIIDSALEGDD